MVEYILEKSGWHWIYKDFVGGPFNTKKDAKMDFRQFMFDLTGIEIEYG